MCRLQDAPPLVPPAPFPGSPELAIKFRNAKSPEANDLKTTKIANATFPKAKLTSAKCAKATFANTTCATATFAKAEVLTLHLLKLSLQNLDVLQPN